MSEAWFDLPPNWQTVYFWVDSKEKAVTDDIQKVREAYEAALQEYVGSFRVTADKELVELIAKRLQPRPEPVKKVWSVSVETGGKFAQTKGEMTPWSEHLNRFAPDIIRERPDLVKADVQRRLAAARFPDDLLLPRLFPELGP